MAFLAKYHGNGSRDNPIVQLEWKQLKENIKLNASDKRWWDYVGVSTYEKRGVTNSSLPVRTYQDAQRPMEVAHGHPHWCLR